MSISAFSITLMTFYKKIRKTYNLAEYYAITHVLSLIQKNFMQWIAVECFVVFAKWTIIYWFMTLTM